VFLLVTGWEECRQAGKPAAPGEPHYRRVESHNLHHLVNLFFAPLPKKALTTSEYCVTVPRMNPIKLRQWRETRSLTQAKAGELLGVAEVTVRFWEAGRRPIPAWLDNAIIGVNAKLYEQQQGGEKWRR
jgi:DNA-binding transcriptional regulator YiaG